MNNIVVEYYFVRCTIDREEEEFIKEEEEEEGWTQRRNQNFKR